MLYQDQIKQKKCDFLQKVEAGSQVHVQPSPDISGGIPTRRTMRMSIAQSSEIVWKSKFLCQSMGMAFIHAFSFKSLELLKLLFQSCVNRGDRYSLENCQK